MSYYTVFFIVDNFGKGDDNSNLIQLNTYEMKFYPLMLEKQLPFTSHEEDQYAG